MGRKNWKESFSQRGPGRKSRKQGDPELPPKLQDQGKGVERTKTASELGGRIKQRARKRAVKSATAKALRQGAKRVKAKDAGGDYTSVPPPPAESAPAAKKRNASSILKSSTKKKSSAQKQVKISLFKDGSDGSSGKWPRLLPGYPCSF